MKIFEVNGRKVRLNKAPEGYAAPKKTEEKKDEQKAEPKAITEPANKARKTTQNKARKAGSNK